MEKLNIICVDDQQEVLNAILNDLQPLATWLNIEDCESADEVLQLMDRLDEAGESIAVVISDHIMPGKTGVELLTQITQDTRFHNTKKVLLTGQASHTDTINAINQAGIARYFEKPWDTTNLIECVRSLVTDYIFDCGLDYTQWQLELDQQIVFARLR